MQNSTLIVAIGSLAITTWGCRDFTGSGVGSTRSMVGRMSSSAGAGMPTASRSSASSAVTRARVRPGLAQCRLGPGLQQAGVLVLRLLASE